MDIFTNKIKEIIDSEIRKSSVFFFTLYSVIYEDPEALHQAEQTAEYVFREMTGPDGEFYSAQYRLYAFASYTFYRPFTFLSISFLHLLVIVVSSHVQYELDNYVQLLIHFLCCMEKRKRGLL